MGGQKSQVLYGVQGWNMEYGPRLGAGENSSPDRLRDKSRNGVIHNPSELQALETEIGVEQGLFLESLTCPVVDSHLGPARMHHSDQRKTRE